MFWNSYPGTTISPRHQRMLIWSGAVANNPAADKYCSIDHSCVYLEVHMCPFVCERKLYEWSGWLSGMEHTIRVKIRSELEGPQSARFVITHCRWDTKELRSTYSWIHNVVGKTASRQFKHYDTFTPRTLSYFHVIRIKYKKYAIHILFSGSCHTFLTYVTCCCPRTHNVSTVMYVSW